MRSAAASNKAGASSFSSPSSLSQIPLPRRKNSQKSDIGVDGDDTDSEYGHNSQAPRSQPKMSLLDSTSFCCTSGQKEDYIPDAKIVPVSRPPKKRPPNVPQKQENLDPSTPKSPLLAAGRSFLARSKKGKPSPECPEDIPVQDGDSVVRNETAKIRPSNPFSEIRLRFGDDRRKITPPSPQRRVQKDPGTPRKDLSGPPRKFSDGLPRFRRDSNSGPDLLNKSIDSSHNYSDNQNPGLNKKLDLNLTPSAKGLEFSSNKSPLGCSLLSNESHDHDDFDCPCCDKTSVMMDEAGLSDIEIKTFTSSNDTSPVTQTMGNKNIFAESGLQLEVKSLKEELEAGKLKLQIQQDLAQHLEEELSVMNHLRQELDKEKELRKIAEDKLLELLDYEKQLEKQKRENEKRMESKCTQMDISESTHDRFLSEENSPLLYEGRIRKYQNYIAKLEKDNLILFNELKKFKDMSPRSQEEQAKVLVDKLEEMERNNQQQQLQYETCLDEVANKLVQTLLAQKRLEEECKILHLRVEQLEQENGTLMELMEEDKVEKVEKENNVKTAHAQSNLNIKQRKPSYHQLTSSPVKKSPTSHKSSTTFEQRTKESTKSTKIKPEHQNASSEPQTPVTSPVSPSLKSGCVSKIPSFHNSKPVVARKKCETGTSSGKSKHDIANREAPELASNLPTSKSKLPSSAKPSKATSAKRKRLSRNSSPADKGTKDSKQRIKSNHVRWDSKKEDADDAPPPYQSIDCMREFSPIPAFPPPQQVWSFNCEVNSNLPVPEIRQKIASSIEAFSDKLCLSLDNPDGKPISSISESSTTLEGPNRTRDEGYSTMSSDLQQDSTADTTLSEPDNSATYVITEKANYFPSDESITECLDGSMCSSSDSGFGPLHHVSILKFSEEFSIDAEASRKELPKFDVSNRKQGTVKSKDQIASVKPTVRSTINQSQNVRSDNKSNTICDKFICDLSTSISDKLSSLKSGDFKLISPSKSKKNVDQSTMIDYWSFPKEFPNLSDFRKTWHLGPTKSNLDDQIVFCTRHSYIDDNLFDEKVETAEKATLTEPEEELWREKALAPFIDESIWSLYSSEGDIQVKHFPLEPLLSEPSLEKLISNCSPCIIVTENYNLNSGIETSDVDKPAIRPTNDSSIADFHFLDQNVETARPILERVASDSVLYLKDAIHELENSMRKGLKSSKNLSALHQDSASESETSPIRELGFKPEIMQTLQATMSKQSQLVWPSPSRSSSLSSLQSCASFHGVSDDMDDVENVRSSRKGSRDPDLSSASDVEYENLDHKDFVERWLQKEITNSNITKMVPSLEPVLEIGESSSTRRASFPCEPALKDCSAQPRMRLNSFPTGSSIPNNPKQDDKPLFASTHPFPKTIAQHSKSVQVNDCSPEILLNIDAQDDGDLKFLDPEAKEFNGDFYTLCSIGSLKSLDRFSPSRNCDIKIKQLSESPILNRRAQPASCSMSTDRSKPTGLVKPTRPAFLAVPSVPKVPEHSMENSDSPLKNYEFLKSLKKPSEFSKNVPKVPCFTDFDVVAKNSNCSKVPSSNQTVFRNNEEPGPSKMKSPNRNFPQSSLPNDNSVKTKSPTRIVFKSSKCDEASKRQWRRDRNASRQNRFKEGCGTAWIHLNPNPSLSDPTIRNSLLESLKAPTSSSGSSDSSAEEEEDRVLVIQTNSHLHQICKEKRHKVKASANNPLYDLRKRTTIMGRRELFYRFGDKEKEAIACFDFLEEIATASMETLNKRVSALEQFPPIEPSNLDLYNPKSSKKEAVHPLSQNTSQLPTNSDSLYSMTDIALSPFSNYSSRQLRMPNLWNKPLSHNMSTSTLNSSQDCELLDHLSLSDSCAESYSSTPSESFEDAS